MNSRGTSGARRLVRKERPLRSKLKQLFPMLAEWPPEKWLGLPIAILLLYGVLIGIGVIFFGERVLD